LRLQAAWDAGDLPALERLTAGPLLDDIRCQLQARGPALNRTDVLRLSAQLLTFEKIRDALVASIEFSGLIRERQDAVAREFRELWMLVKLHPSDDGAWRLAQLHALT
jgi:predicted lipid-binding transport protein (Tim44 family)